MVVLAMLTLFAAVGLAFVSYTESEATQAQNQKLSEVVKLPDADIVFNQAMRQIIFGTADGGSALYTHSLLADMYGLATGQANQIQNRMPFTGTGALSVRDPSGVLDVSPPATLPVVSNNARYFPNFQGRVYDESVFGSRNPPYTYANHDHMFLGAWSNTGNGNEVVARSFVRDAVIRLQLTAMPGQPDYVDFAFNPYDLSDPKIREFWSWTPNAAALYSFDLPIPPPPTGRTYASPPVYPNPNPDPNHPFVRRFFAIAPSPEHTNDRNILRAMVMRPGPWDHFRVAGGIATPTFPPPGDFGGDVKNLAPDMKTVVKYTDNASPSPTRFYGNADSIWTDCNFPILTGTNGKKYKPLASWFVTDMEGKVNLNIAGNQRGLNTVNGPYSVSANGLGPYEINPAKIISPQEAQNLFMGKTLITGNTAGMPRQIEYGRYGYTSEGSTPPRNAPTNISFYNHLLRPAPFYSTINLDGTTDGTSAAPDTYQPSPRYLLNGSPAGLIDRFPTGNGVNQGYNNGLAAEVTQFPNAIGYQSPLYSSPFNPFFPTPLLFAGGSTQTFPRSFSPQNLHAMYNGGPRRPSPPFPAPDTPSSADVGADALESELRRLLPIAFTDPAALRRLTTVSYDLNRSPVAPWVDNYNDANKQFAFLTSTDVRPVGQPIAYPAGPPITYGDYYPVPSPTQPSTWRSILATLPRLDLDRPLPDYPVPMQNGAPALGVQFDLTDPVTVSSLTQAVLARQELARDIFYRFILITNAYEAQRIDAFYRTGIMPPFAAVGTPLQEDALRWLAQLSVNIVDYIDNDDYMTPFDWYAVLGRGVLGSQFVFGTELPRLQINEVYVEAVNDPRDINGPRANFDYGVSTWVELYNPLTSQSSPGFSAWNDGPNVRFQIGGQSVYRLVVTTSNNVSNIRTHGNVLGDANNVGGLPNYLDVAIQGYPAPTIPPGSVRANGDIAPGDNNYVRPNPLTVNPPPQNQYNQASFSAVGFYLIGPSNFPSTAPPANQIQLDETNPQLAIQNRYTHTAPNDQAGQIGTNQDDWQAVLLRRLACPYLPAQPDPTQPLYNPYITIDYAEKIIPNNAIQFNATGTNPTPPYQPPNSRHSIGKPQPYASQWQLWRKADPVPLYADGTTPQHTFLRHNGREATYAALNPADASPNPQTIKTPFDWLVHLDRPLMSPAELLQISGYKPHELTQQFVATPPTTPMAQYTLPVAVAPGSQTINLAARGVVGGIPWTMQVNDLVLIVDPNYGPTATREWVCVTGVAPDYSSFTATFNQAHPGGPSGTGAAVLVQVPHAQVAPWFSADDAITQPSPPYTSSSYRIYRLLDMVAVRNPQVQIGQGRMFIGSATFDAATGTWLLTISQTDPIYGQPSLTPSAMPLVAPNGAIADIGPGTVLAFYAGPDFPLGPTAPLYYVRVMAVNKDTNTIQVAFPVHFANNNINGFALDMTFHGGRQPGRMNLNSIYDQEVFAALLDRQRINVFTDINVYNEQGNDVSKEFQRLYAARQPKFFTSPARPRIGALRNDQVVIAGTPYPIVAEDTPLLPLSTGDAPGSGLGIGRTMLQPVANDTNLETLPPSILPPTIPQRDPRNRLFETGFYEPSQNNFTPVTNPAERFDVLSKVFNNTTTRSNAFAVWLTIGFFEVDDNGVLGAELQQLDGRNTRYRFFAVVDRSVLDEWFAANNYMVDPTQLAANALITNTSIDPRYASDTNPAAICQAGQYGTAGGTTWQLTLNTNTNYTQFSVGQIVQVTGMIPNPSGPGLVPITENTQIQTVAANVITARLRYGKQYAIANSDLVVKQLPVPATILYWSQIK
jgi:hypothetical protein